MNLPDPVRRALDSDPARKAAEEGRYLAEQLRIGPPKPLRWLWRTLLWFFVGVAAFCLVVLVVAGLIRLMGGP